MKAFEFQTKLCPDRSVPLPPEVANQISPQQQLRVIILVEEPDEEREWVRSANQQFLLGYAEGDAIYDRLSTG